MNHVHRSVSLIVLLMISAQARAIERPNVVIVMTDDQGYPEVSAHGNPVLQTPNLDALHSRSLRLTDFHVAPMCAPTRGQLLTGLDAARNGCINVSSGRALLRPEIPTMANIFGVEGYSTGFLENGTSVRTTLSGPKTVVFNGPSGFRPLISARFPTLGATTILTIHTPAMENRKGLRAIARTFSLMKRSVS